MYCTVHTVLYVHPEAPLTRSLNLFVCLVLFFVGLYVSLFFNRFSCKILHLDTSRTARHRPTYPSLSSASPSFVLHSTVYLYSQIRVSERTRRIHIHSKYLPVFCVQRVRLPFTIHGSCIIVTAWFLVAYFESLM
jgi:hypothetical protein